MTTKEFGEIIVALDEYPKGIAILEDENGVALAEILDDNGRDINILHKFEEGYTLRNKENLYDCLVTARKYEKDFTVPIYITCVLHTLGNVSASNEDEERRCKKCIADWIGQYPWAMFPKSKCEQCKFVQNS